jgi:hypothetical protein
LLFSSECSALEGTNVLDMFSFLAKCLYVNYKDLIDQQRAVSYLGGKSALSNSVLSSPDEAQLHFDPADG